MNYFKDSLLKHHTSKRVAAGALTMYQCSTLSETWNFNKSKVNDAPLHTMTKFPNSSNFFYCLSGYIAKLNQRNLQVFQKILYSQK